MNIQTPNSNYPTSNDYGYGSNGDYNNYSNDPGVQAWASQAQQYRAMYVQYLQQLSQGGIDASERVSYQTVVGYLNQLDSMMSEMGINPSPMMGDGFGGGFGDNFGMTDLGTDQGGMGVSPGQDQGPSFPVSYQDQNHIVSEDGSDVSVTVSRNDSDTRDIDFYQPNGTVVIPSNAASVNVTAGKDDAGKDMVIVKITFPNGATRTLNFHDPKNLNIQAAKPENVKTNDASLAGNPALAGKVTVTELGSTATDKKQLGDDPTSTNGKDRTFDGKDFTIAPVPEGSDVKTTVLASGDVSLIPNSNSEFYSISYDATAKQYVVKVYASKDDMTASPPKVKETITIDGELLNHLNLEIDPSRVNFEAPLGDANGKLDSTNADAKKIQFSGEGAPADLPATLQGLLDATGKTSDDLLKALQDAGYSEFKTIDDVTQAVIDGKFPPSAPDAKTLKFLTALDPTLEGPGTEDKWKTLLTKLYEGSDHVINVGQVQADATHSTVQFSFDDKTVIYDFTNDKILDPSSQWPMSSSILDNWTVSHDSSYGGKSLKTDLVGKIATAFLVGDSGWADVVNFIGQMDPKYGNDVIREFMTALNRVAGNSPEKLKGLLQLLPPEVRTSMIQKVMEKSDEITSEKTKTGYDNANWTSDDVARMIQASLSE